MVNRIVTFLVAVVVFFGFVFIRPYLRQADRYSRAEGLVSEGKYDDAFFAFGDIIRLNPDDPLPYYRRAVAMQAGAVHSKAQMDFNDVIRLRPDFGPAYRLRAISKRAMGLEEPAQADEAKADQLGADKDVTVLQAIKEIPDGPGT